jgi:hypothetical protein
MSRRVGRRFVPQRTILDRMDRKDARINRALAIRYPLAGTRQQAARWDALAACLRYLAAERTKGRMDLYTAVHALAHGAR